MEVNLLPRQDVKSTPRLTGLNFVSSFQAQKRMHKTSVSVTRCGSSRPRSLPGASFQNSSADPGELSLLPACMEQGTRPHALSQCSHSISIMVSGAPGLDGKTEAWESLSLVLKLAIRWQRPGLESRSLSNSNVHVLSATTLFKPFGLRPTVTNT